MVAWLFVLLACAFVRCDSSLACLSATVACAVAAALACAAVCVRALSCAWRASVRGAVILLSRCRIVVATARFKRSGTAKGRARQLYHMAISLIGH